MGYAYTMDRIALQKRLSIRHKGRYSRTMDLWFIRKAWRPGIIHYHSFVWYVDSHRFQFDVFSYDERENHTRFVSVIDQRRHKQSVHGCKGTHYWTFHSCTFPEEYMDRSDQSFGNRYSHNTSWLNSRCVDGNRVDDNVDVKPHCPIIVFVRHVQGILCKTDASHGFHMNVNFANIFVYTTWCRLHQTILSRNPLVCQCSREFMLPVCTRETFKWTMTSQIDIQADWSTSTTVHNRCRNRNTDNSGHM
jgi:hypothetical protein